MLAIVPNTVAMPPHPQVVRIVGARLDVGLVDVVRPDRVERRDVARHARHETGEQRGQAEAQQARRIERLQQQRQRAVVVDLAGRVCHGRASPTSARMTIPGRITRNGKSIFGTAATSGVRRAAFIDLGRHRALDDQEVGAPVAERQDEAEAHRHAEPLDAHRVGRGAAQVLPRLGEHAGREPARQSPPSPASPGGPATSRPPSGRGATSGRKPKTIRKNCSTSL